jgi:hypothetical protein
MRFPTPAVLAVLQTEFARQKNAVAFRMPDNVGQPVAPEATGGRSQWRNARGYAPYSAIACSNP